MGGPQAHVTLGKCRRITCPRRPSGQGPLLFLLASLANAVNLEGVARRQVLVLAANFLLNAFDVARKELHRAAAFGADHVMVVAAIVLLFITGHAVIEGNFAGQPALGQQLQSPIDSGKSDALVVFLDQPIQFVGGEVVTGVEKGAQDDTPLPRLLEAHALEMPMENRLSLAHYLARDGWLIVNSFLKHGACHSPVWGLSTTQPPRNFLSA